MSGSNGEWTPPRRLRVFAFDPTTSRSYANRRIREVTISIAAEMDPGLRPGPLGEYLEVIDHDPACRVFYNPIDLDDPRILSDGGLAPAEESPQFHQQMVYAVAMNTIATFEEALGRPVLWAPLTSKLPSGEWQETYIGQLRLYPHALCEANAYYSPTRKALLFGYFEAGADSRGALPGSTVFTCLSHDIIVHETVHAILDGLHPHFAENSHPDMLALHEAFADIVAILQLFSFPEVIEEQILRTRGDLESQSMLGQLAQEFGRTLGRSHSLRDALGETASETGTWRPKRPDPTALRRAHGPHDRGSVLVAALFRSFLNVYQGQTEDLFRMASGGSGILRKGTIDPDLAARLAKEAAQIARRILRIAIRAMDYVPPVAVSFGDYLRGIVTADHDLYPEDREYYRTAIIEAFTSWGIVPAGQPVMTERTLIWPTISQAAADFVARQATGGGVNIKRLQGSLGALLSRPEEVLGEIQRSATAPTGQYRDRLMSELHTNRKGLASKVNDRLTEINKMRRSGALAEPYESLQEVLPEEAAQINMSELGRWVDRETEFHGRNYLAKVVWMLANARMTTALADLLGITLSEDAPLSVRRSSATSLPSLHVLPVRRARRVGPRGKFEDEYVIEMVQTRYGFMSAADQAHAEQERAFAEGEHDFKYRAGCTLLVNAQDFAIRRLIRTPYPVHSDEGLARMRADLSDIPKRRNGYDDGTVDASAAFAMLHRTSGHYSEDW